MDDDDNVLGWVTHVETPSDETSDDKYKHSWLGRLLEDEKPFVCLSWQMKISLYRGWEKLSSFNLHFCVFNVRYISHSFFVISEVETRNHFNGKVVTLWLKTTSREWKTRSMIFMATTCESNLTFKSKSMGWKNNTQHQQDSEPLKINRTRKGREKSAKK